MLMGTFNAKPTDTALSDLCEVYNLIDTVLDKACFKNRVTNRVVLI